MQWVAAVEKIERSLSTLTCLLLSLEERPPRCGKPPSDSAEAGQSSAKPVRLESADVCSSEACRWYGGEARLQLRWNESVYRRYGVTWHWAA